jgi:hypothetical protein
MKSSVRLIGLSTDECLLARHSRHVLYDWVALGENWCHADDQSHVLLDSVDLMMRSLRSRGFYRDRFRLELSVR